MISRWLAFAVILLGLVAGCETKTVRVDSRVVGQRLHERIQQVLERPAVDKAIDAFIEAVAADPVLQPAAAKLAVVFEDPTLLEVAGSVLERVKELPAMQVIVRETMAAHPDASPENIGEMVGADLERAFESANFDAVFNEFGRHLMGGRMTELLTAGLTPRIEAALTTYETQWSKRLTELNGGSTPSVTRATELFLERGWTSERIEKCLLGLLESPAVRHETARIVVTAIGLPAVAAELRRVASDLAQDLELQRDAVEVFSLLLQPPRNEVAPAAAMRKLVMSRRVPDSLRDLLAFTLTQPEVGRVASDSLDEVGAAPATRRVCDELLTGW